MLTSPHLWLILLSCVYGLACKDGTQEPVLRVVMAIVCTRCLTRIVEAWEDEHEGSCE